MSRGSRATPSLRVEFSASEKPRSEATCGSSVRPASVCEHGRGSVAPGPPQSSRTVPPVPGFRNAVGQPSTSAVTDRTAELPRRPGLWARADAPLEFVDVDLPEQLLESRADHLRRSAGRPDPGTKTARLRRGDVHLLNELPDHSVGFTSRFCRFRRRGRDGAIYGKVRNRLCTGTMGFEPNPGGRPHFVRPLRLVGFESHALRCSLLTFVRRRITGTMGFEPPELRSLALARSVIRTHLVRLRSLTSVSDTQYGHDGIRTHDRRIRSPTLYPD